MIYRALYLDQRSVEDVAQELLDISARLEAFKQKNPRIFKQLCQEAVEGGDMTLEDALDAVASAVAGLPAGRNCGREAVQ